MSVVTPQHWQSVHSTSLEYQSMIFFLQLCNMQRKKPVHFLIAASPAFCWGHRGCWSANPAVDGRGRAGLRPEQEANLLTSIRAFALTPTANLELPVRLACIAFGSRSTWREPTHGQGEQEEHANNTQRGPRLWNPSHGLLAEATAPTATAEHSPRWSNRNDSGGSDRCYRW